MSTLFPRLRHRASHTFSFPSFRPDNVRAIPLSLCYSVTVSWRSFPTSRVDTLAHHGKSVGTPAEFRLGNLSVLDERERDTRRRRSRTFDVGIDFRETASRKGSGRLTRHIRKRKISRRLFESIKARRDLTDTIVLRMILCSTFAFNNTSFICRTRQLASKRANRKSINGGIRQVANQETVLGKW